MFSKRTIFLHCDMSQMKGKEKKREEERGEIHILAK